MNDKIIIALRRRYHCERVRTVLRQNYLDYPVYEISEGDTSYTDLRRLIPDDACILITGDVYAAPMMEQLNLAVVTIRRSKIPFSDSIHQALQLADRAALIWRETDSTAAQRACLKFQNAVSFFPIDTVKSDLEPLFEHLKQSGFRVIIGAGTLNAYASRYNMEIVNVPYDEEDILSAVRLAEHNLRFMEQLQQFSETLKSIQNHIAEGIIALDPEGNIQTINAFAAHILQVELHTLEGISLERTSLACSETQDLLQRFEAFSNKILFIKGVSIAMSGQPIFVNQILKAAILTLTPVEQLQHNEQMIRAQMNAPTGIASVSFQDIIGESPALVEAIRIAQRYARVDSSVLITGESGTGKEMFVQSIHNASARCGAPFVVINCAALPESLIESELFGYEKGAFTNALSSGKQGLFERGHKGTVFLDEISEMPLHVQARFLRVLQERTVTPIGGNRVIPVDLRIIAATNRDLREMVEKKLFREDLYYRISVLTIRLPPLHEREGDIALLTRHFVRYKSKSLPLAITDVEQSAIDYLQTRSYPGNIRQLSNLVERAMVLCQEKVLNLDAVIHATTDNTSLSPQYNVSSSATGACQLLQRESIQQVLSKHHGNRAMAAQELGISISTLYRRMKQLDISTTYGANKKEPSNQQ